MTLATARNFAYSSRRSMWQSGSGVGATDPECFAGLKGSTRTYSAAVLLSQGPAPQSAWGFAFGRSGMDDGYRSRTRKPGQGARTGFGVMRSPDRCLSSGGERTAMQARFDRPARCTRCRGSGKQRSRVFPTGLALLRPSTVHQQQNLMMRHPLQAPERVETLTSLTFHVLPDDDERFDGLDDWQCVCSFGRVYVRESEWPTLRDELMKLPRPN